MWAGSAQLNGLDSAQQELGRSRPNKVSYFFLGRTWLRQQRWARISLAHKHIAGPEPVWPKEKKTQQCWARISLAHQHNIRGGIIFPLPSCMQNFVRSACRETTTKMQTIRGRKVTWCGGGGALLWLTVGDSKR